MITIQIVRDTQHKMIAFEIDGHAGYDEEGHDIVCAAVSGITLTAALGLRDYAKAEGSYKNQKGHMSVRITRPDETTQAIMETMVLGLDQISRQYPEFVSIHEV